MKYRKKPVIVDAEQWYPGKKIEGVEEISAELIFSRDGKYYYLHAFTDTIIYADAWIEVMQDTGPAGPVLPFAFYEVKVGERRPAVETDPLVQKYIAYRKFDGTVRFIYARMKDTREGNIEVYPGDWIVTYPGGRRDLVGAANFDTMYEPAE